MALRVAIVGGGIGGLAAGIALRRGGCDVQVYERTPALAEVGSGISLWANAIRALESIGLGDAVRAIATPAAGALRRQDGRLLSAPPASLVQRIRDFCLVVHRAELQTMLVQALGPRSLTLGARSIGVEQDDAGASLALEDGRRIRADIVIGADGLNSVVRAALHGAAAPDYAGYTAWRGVTTVEPDTLLPGETWGAGRRFGQVPLTRGRVYWFAAANAREGERSPGGERPALLRMFRGWHQPIEALIERTPETDILRNDIYDRPPLTAWGRGRVTLLGDAAHPMTPNLGQGACQAIEDAVVLARCLARGTDLATALQTYEKSRRARVDAVVRESRQVGRVAQWEQPIAVRLRDFLVERLAGRLQAARLEALVGYDVTADPQDQRG